LLGAGIQHEGLATRKIDEDIGRAVADPERAQRVSILIDEIAQRLLEAPSHR